MELIILISIYIWSLTMLYNKYACCEYGVPVKLKQGQPLKTIKQGQIRGRYKILPQNKTIETYFGVPFAKPPVKELRFKPPQPLESWPGINEVGDLARACQQPRDEYFPGFWGAEMWNADSFTTEDCLYLNMWVPPSGNNLSTLVWIFGGGFWYGSPSLKLYQAEGLAAEGNVIVINLNYRVGPFGFLFLNDKEAPGNVGLLDQQMALQWIKDNIQFFGGNPDLITLFGESAGAASVVAHMIAPGSQKLFNSGILQSGSLQNPWAYDPPKRALEKSLFMAQQVGCNRSQMSEIIECMMKANASDLAAKSVSVEWYTARNGKPAMLRFMEFPLVIVSRDANFFRGDDAIDALHEGRYKHCPLMVGVNANEGTFWMAYFFPQYFSKDGNGKANHSAYVESVRLSLDRENRVVQTAAQLLYDEGNCYNAYSELYTHGVDQVVGDYQFTCDSLWLADRLSSNAHVYVFYFNHRITSNPWPAWMGSMHGYEVEFVFGIPLVNKSYIQGSGSYTRLETLLSKETVHIWSSFAYHGVPRLPRDSEYYITWPRYDALLRKHIVLRPGRKVIELGLKQDKCSFWDQVVDTNYKLQKFEHLTMSASCLSLSAATIALLATVATLSRTTVLWPFVQADLR